MKEPTPEEFGFTDEEYRRFTSVRNSSAKLFENWIYYSVYFAAWISSPLIAYSATGDWSVAGPWIFYGFFTSFLAAGFLLLIASIPFHLLEKHEEYRMARSALASKIALFREAQTHYHNVLYEDEKKRREAERSRQEIERARRRKQIEHWKSLSGLDFERELGTLYKHLGYDVEPTPRTGDQGVDLFLRKGKETTIVQCRSHVQPVGPAVVRELYGALVASGSTKAILACPSGFTKGVHEFVREKPIALVSASQLATMSEGVSDDRVQEVSNADVSQAPICPTPRCGRKMVIRNGRYGDFWGCPNYPRCRGARDVA